MTIITAMVMYMMSQSSDMGMPPLELRLATSSGSIMMINAVSVSPKTTTILGAYAVLSSSSDW